MKEANDHYIEDSLWEVENFLQSVSIDKNLLDERTLDDMAYHYYKNYYDYEMDEEYAHSILHFYKSETLPYLFDYS